MYASHSHYKINALSTPILLPSPTYSAFVLYVLPKQKKSQPVQPFINNSCEYQLQHHTLHAIRNTLKHQIINSPPVMNALLGDLPDPRFPSTVFATHVIDTATVPLASPKRQVSLQISPQISYQQPRLNIGNSPHSLSLLTIESTKWSISTGHNSSIADHVFTEFQYFFSSNPAYAKNLSTSI